MHAADADVRFCDDPGILEPGHEKMCLMSYANNKGHQRLCCSLLR